MENAVRFLVPEGCDFRMWQAQSGCSFPSARLFAQDCAMAEPHLTRDPAGADSKRASALGRASVLQ